jgi:hypothetical protein
MSGMWSFNNKKSVVHTPNSSALLFVPAPVLNVHLSRELEFKLITPPTPLFDPFPVVEHQTTPLIGESGVVF